MSRSRSGSNPAKVHPSEGRSDCRTKVNPSDSCLAPPHHGLAIAHITYSSRQHRSSRGFSIASNARFNSSIMARGGALSQSSRRGRATQDRFCRSKGDPERDSFILDKRTTTTATTAQARQSYPQESSRIPLRLDGDRRANATMDGQRRWRRRVLGHHRPCLGAGRCRSSRAHRRSVRSCSSSSVSIQLAASTGPPFPARPIPT